MSRAKAGAREGKGTEGEEEGAREEREWREAESSREEHYGNEPPQAVSPRHEGLWEVRAWIREEGMHDLTGCSSNSQKSPTAQACRGESSVNYAREKFWGEV